MLHIMSTVRVPALKPLTYQGRSYVRGDLVLVDPADALVMSRRGEVTLTRGKIIGKVIAPEQESAIEPPARQRRTYRRRDLTAEPVGE